MAILKTSMKPFVLLVAALEVQFEVLDGHPQKQKGNLFSWSGAAELRVEFRPDLRIAKLKA